MLSFVKYFDNFSWEALYKPKCYYYRCCYYYYFVYYTVIIDFEKYKYWGVGGVGVGSHRPNRRCTTWNDSLEVFLFFWVLFEEINVSRISLFKFLQHERDFLLYPWDKCNCLFLPTREGENTWSEERLASPIAAMKLSLTLETFFFFQHFLAVLCNNKDATLVLCHVVLPEAYQ